MDGQGGPRLSAADSCNHVPWQWKILSERRHCWVTKTLGVGLPPWPGIVLWSVIIPQKAAWNEGRTRLACSHSIVETMLLKTSDHLIHGRVLSELCSYRRVLFEREAGARQHQTDSKETAPALLEIGTTRLSSILDPASFFLGHSLKGRGRDWRVARVFLHQCTNSRITLLATTYSIHRWRTSSPHSSVTYHVCWQLE